ncbi:MAG: hypothetical protein DRJ26_03410, partial [Candidatus Methanomethylicota archaeon]
MIRAVLFDFWRTLFQPAVEINEYYNIRVKKLFEILREVKRDLTLDEVGSAYREIRGLCDKIRCFGVEVPLFMEVKLLLYHLGIYSFSSSFIFKVMEAYMFPFIYHTRPRADAKEVLRRLRQLGLKVAIVSNVLSGRHITDALEKWRLIEYFDVTIYSDEIGFRK